MASWYNKIRLEKMKFKIGNLCSDLGETLRIWHNAVVEWIELVRQRYESTRKVSLDLVQINQC